MWNVMILWKHPISFPVGSVDKESAWNAGDAADAVQSLGREDPLEEGVVTHSSIPA